MKLILSLLAGLIVGTVLGFYLHNPYVHTQRYQINACVDFYMSNINPTDADIVEAMKQQGFKTVKELVKNHCKWYVVDAGQTFDQLRGH